MSRKKTNEEYCKQVFDLVGDEYTVLSEYVGSTIKVIMRHNCRSCENYTWDISPNVFIGNKNKKGTRCPKCSGLMRKTHEEYVEEIRIKRPDIEVLGRYINSNTKILHKCKCNNEQWMVTPTNVISGVYCSVCSGTIKKTTQSYIDELSLIRPRIKVIGEYIDSKTKILHECECENNSWLVTPNEVLNGSKCMECNKSKKKTHEEYVEGVRLVNPNIVVIGTYVDRKTPILHICSCKNNQWVVAPFSVLRGGKCLICSGNPKKTQKQFVSDIHSLVSDEYKVLGEYKLSNKKILFKHNSIDCEHHEFEMKPNCFMNGQRCPKCFGTPKKTTEQFKNEMYVLFGDEYELIGEYDGLAKNVSIKHNICGNIRNTLACIILQGSTCQDCTKRVSPSKKSQEKFEDDIKNITNGEYSVLGEYVNTNTKVLIQHNNTECNNHQFEAIPNNFLRGSRCPKCNYSKGEVKINNHLNFLGIELVAQKTFPGLVGIRGGSLSYDFYLPNYSLLIEYQGEFHDGISRDNDYLRKNLEKQKEHDKRKREYAQTNNIKLLEIWYWDFDNIEQILTDELKLHKQESA